MSPSLRRFTRNCLLSSLSMALTLAGCTYEWTVAPAPAPDGGQAGDAGDAGAEAEAGSDAQLSPACQQRLDALAQARVGLKDCSPDAGPAGWCVYEVIDECDCSFSIAKPLPPASYASLVEDFEDAGCVAECSGCPLDPVFFECKENPDGAPAQCMPVY